MEQEAYAFISYSTKDVFFVTKLADILKSCGIFYWKAPEMIPAGSNYAKEIPKAIQNCTVFILVLSESAQESIWVEKEVDTAICHRKKIIPLKIEDLVLNEMYRFYLNNVQFVDARVTQETTWDQIAERLKGVFLDWKQTNIKAGDSKVAPVSEERICGKIATRETVDVRSNALRINKIPLECEYCNGVVQHAWAGVYTCLNCGRENYDEFQKVRNFLEKVGAAPAVVIAKNTGVSLRTIDYFFKQDYIGTIEQEMVHGRKQKGVCHLNTWKK